MSDQPPDPLADPAALLRALQPLLDAVGASIVPAPTRSSDVRVAFGDKVEVTIRPPDLRRSLDTLLASTQRSLGTPLGRLSAEQVRRAVQLLDERGAFVLRGSVAKVARTMGVSRSTVYKHLNDRYR